MGQPQQGHLARGEVLASDDHNHHVASAIVYDHDHGAGYNDDGITDYYHNGVPHYHHHATTTTRGYDNDGGRIYYNHNQTVRIAAYAALYDTAVQPREIDYDDPALDC